MAEEYAEAVDTILNIPSEYVPTLIVVVAVVSLIVTLARHYPAYTEKYKEDARTKGQAIAYGLGYIETDMANIAAGLVATIILTGWLIGQGIISADTGMDVYVTAAVIAVFAVYLGDKYVLSAFHEARRDKAKGDEALETKKDAEVKTEEEPSEVVIVKQ